MSENATQFFKCLADETRLSILLLIQAEEELCVCEFIHVLDASQPKISRHLAQLRSCELVADRRQGQWVYYRLHPELPGWARNVLESTAKGCKSIVAEMQRNLDRMDNRPERRSTCC
ncbi:MULTISPECIES: metalloregulator ArsR/SmtB family transcription factor [Halomonadaceae]|uniref:metalloregulator ArsR/SmtB family transcription factor n=1 Tax=Halomonadaceae TaxID=28256 RepID=UPI00159AF9EE|nr:MULTISPECIES: metalloregulator ArsR/SmtB family transcription factor [unclassified Halomonas]QJQ96602.1 metalloregulator ArsR/SmtB family transcription factor [Halomonas sp. PA5]